MQAPTLSPEPFITLELTLRPTIVGRTPFGDRQEVYFDGSARSELWDGDWAAEGVDHIVVGRGGVVRIDVHVTIAGSGPGGEREVVTYRGHGRSGGAGVVEGVTFETSSERLGELDTTVAVGRGSLDGDRLSIALYRIRP